MEGAQEHANRKVDKDLLTIFASMGEIDVLLTIFVEKMIIRYPGVPAYFIWPRPHSPEFQYCLFVRLVSEHILSWAL